MGTAIAPKQNKPPLNLTVSSPQKAAPAPTQLAAPTPQKMLTIKSKSFNPETTTISTPPVTQGSSINTPQRDSSNNLANAFGVNSNPAPINAGTVNNNTNTTIGKGGSIPKVNQSNNINVGGTTLDYNAPEKYNARQDDLIGQLNTIFTQSTDPKLQELANRLKFGAPGQQKGAAFIQGFKDQKSAFAALNHLKETLPQELVNKLNIKVDKGEGGYYRIEFSGGTISPNANVTNPSDPNIDKNVNSVNDANAFNEQLRESIGEMIINAQKQKAGSFGAGQDALGREIPGVGETSPEQEAQVQRQIQAMKDIGLEQINRDLATNTSRITSDLMSRGFQTSNVTPYALEQNVWRPDDINRRNLLRELVTQENEIRNSISTRQNNAVDTLNKLNEPNFPTNVPGVIQFSPGTITPKATFQDVATLADLIMAKIPGLDQAAAVEIAKSYINAQTQGIASPGLGTQLLTAGSGIAAAAAKGAGAGSKKGIKSL